LGAEYGSDGSANPGGVQWLTADHLGTTRVVTMGGESRYQDYLPFGEPLLGGWRAQMASYTDNSGVAQKFTSKERDQETGLDYFGARYFSGAQGRFTSPDEPFADQNFSYPQSWNLYAYGRNNPLRFFDLDGRKCVQTDGGGWADDGSGGGCDKAGVDANGNIKSQQVQVQDYEPPSPLLLAAAQGAQRAGPTVNAVGIATGVVLTGGAVGIGAGAIGGGTGLISLSIGATRAAQLAPLLLPAGQKLAQIIARLGAGQQNPQLVLQKLTELRDTAVAAGTYVQGFYIQSGVTIYRVGQNFLTVSGQGKILSYVQNATPGTGVVERYIEMGGK
jgi:RHS repeat-associated protein